METHPFMVPIGFKKIKYWKLAWILSFVILYNDAIIHHYPTHYQTGYNGKPSCSASTILELHVTVNQPCQCNVQLWKIVYKNKVWKIINHYCCADGQNWVFKILYILIWKKVVISNRYREHFITKKSIDLVVRYDQGIFCLSYRWKQLCKQTVEGDLR